MISAFGEENFHDLIKTPKRLYAPKITYKMLLKMLEYEKQLRYSTTFLRKMKFLSKEKEFKTYEQCNLFIQLHLSLGFWFFGKNLGFLKKIWVFSKKIGFFENIWYFELIIGGIASTHTGFDDFTFKENQHWHVKENCFKLRHRIEHKLRKEENEFE